MQAAATQVNESRRSSPPSLTACYWQKLWISRLSPVLIIRAELFVLLSRICKAVNVVSRKYNIFTLLWNMTTEKKRDKSNKTKTKICLGLVIMEENWSSTCQHEDIKISHSQTFILIFSHSLTCWLLSFTYLCDYFQITFNFICLLGNRK